MSQMYVDIIQSMSGVVTILAGFFGAFFYLRKRTRDWKVIITASLVIAILVGVGFYGFGGSQAVKGAVVNIAPTPKHTLNDWCKYYLAGDYGRQYDELLSVNSPLKNETRADFIKATIDKLKMVNGLNSCIVNDDIKESGNTARGTLTFIHGDMGVTTSEYILEKDGYEWKILI
jgi:hypothetical protein